MKNVLFFDVEDWFQVDKLRSAVPRSRRKILPLRVEANTRRILALLRNHRTKATSFFLCWVVEWCSQFVKDIKREGYEVVSHGYGHDLVYRLTAESLPADIHRFKQLLADSIGKPVLEYRALRFSIIHESIWAIDVLQEEGFKYDSSAFSVSLYDRYGFAERITLPFCWQNGLLEIPLAVCKIRNVDLPVADGGCFRLFPHAYFKYLLRRLNTKRQRFMFYLHPWRLDPRQPRVRARSFFRCRHYVNLDETERGLSQLLTEFAFERVATAYNVTEEDGVQRSVRYTSTYANRAHY